MGPGRIAGVAGLFFAAGSGAIAAETPALHLSSYQAGETARHRLVLGWQAGDAQTHAAALTYPDGFRFEGFDERWPAGTPVGSYELDVDLDGAPDRTSAVLSLARDRAWVDLLPDGRFDESFEPALRHRGAARFELRLPYGGDADPATLVAGFDARATLVLFEGLLVNPALGGASVVVADIVSVDPDTGGADDRGGTSPSTRRLELPLAIAGPAIAPFARLEVERLDVKEDHHDRWRFRAHGRYVLGPGSDGVDLASENVTVAFDGFQQTLPGSAFVPTGSGHHLRGAVTPGIERLRLWSDGRFQIDGRDLARRDVPRTVTFVLAIGNDRGETRVPRDCKPGHDRP